MTASMAQEKTKATLRAVLCGSFRRERSSLEEAFRELQAHYVLLSPSALDFVDGGAPFVRLAHEVDESVHTIEARHLAAVAEADFVWLHSPNGYVGPSAALELGHARALGIPVFSAKAPEDETLAAFVSVVPNPESVASAFQADPGSGLAALQSYYRRTADRRGWSRESAKDTLLLMTEEFGELARAVRQWEGIARASGFDNVNAAEELADVQLYLVHLANVMGIDLASAVSSKERVNQARQVRADDAA